MYRRHHQHNLIFGKVEPHGFKLVANFKSKHRFIFDEEGAVGAKLAGIANHFFVCHTQIKILVYQPDKKSSISRTTAKPGANWDIFMQMDFYRWQVEIFF